MKTAVIAHYDPDSVWDENFLVMLRVLSEVVDRIIVVTTSARAAALPDALRHVCVVHRPNVGYDFYSYRVGIHLALSSGECDELLLLNSSILILNAARFRTLLRELLQPGRPSPVRGLTESTQFGWHLQSYLLYFELRRLPERWLQDFFGRVEPVNTKFEVVLRYELGLGLAIREKKIPAEAVYRPSPRRRVLGTLAYLRSLTRTQGLRFWLSPAAFQSWRMVNWSHFCAIPLARTYGIAKAELLRTNPHKLPLAPIWDSCAPDMRKSVEQAVKRTCARYAVQRSGLTEIENAREPTGIIKEIVTLPRFRHAGPRVAAVVHLFYFDLFEEILDCLGNILEPFDLYVTTPFEADLPGILDAACRRRQPVSVITTHNRGRDIGPFIALYRTGMLDRYDAVIKLHSKKSGYSNRGAQWRQQLYGALCGDSLTVLRSLRLLREAGCGVVGPARSFLTHARFWGANRDQLARILRACSIPVGPQGPALNFFAGSMFWFTPGALARIHRCPLEVLGFEPENGKQDGTLAHAWERTFCLMARASGYRVSTVELNGNEILESDNQFNCVPVLLQ